MQCQFVLTFEFDAKPPASTRGATEAATLTTVVKRAVQKATDDHPHASWRSLVLVLEREGVES
jgi:hypothetical protein